MKYVFQVLLLITTLSGCSLIPKFPSITAPERPQTIYKWDESEIKTPVVNDQGALIGEQIKRQVNINFAKGPEKLSFPQRLGRVISNMSLWLIVLLFIGVAFFPTTVVPLVLRQGNKYKLALRQTVAAIKEARDDRYSLKQKLQEKHDVSTRRIVNQLRAEL